MKLHESNVIFVKFHTRSQRTNIIVVVHDKILIHEDEHENEKYQIRLPAYNQTPETPGPDLNLYESGR